MANQKTLEKILADWPAAPPTPGRPAKSAPTIDEILAEFKSTPVVAAPAQDGDDTEPKSHQPMADKARAEFLEVLAEVTPELAEADPTIVADLISGELRRDPKLGRAWAGRKKDPAAWKQTAELLGRRLMDRLPGRVAPAERALASRAAGRVALVKVPTPLQEEDERAMAMGDAEFARHMKKLTRVSF